MTFDRIREGWYLPLDRFISLMQVRISFPSFPHNIHAYFRLLTLYAFQPKKQRSPKLDTHRVISIHLLLLWWSNTIDNSKLGLYVMRGTVKTTIKILTIEDDPAQIEALKEALTVAQIICVEILEAEDGDQAMAFLHQEYPHIDAPQPDLIFLSNHLPDRSGYEIIKELQQDRRLQTIPIALFSERNPSTPSNVTFPDNCHLFMRPNTCNEWIYVLRCIEDVWISLINMAGRPNI